MTRNLVFGNENMNLISNKQKKGHGGEAVNEKANENTQNLKMEQETWANRRTNKANSKPA